VQRRRWRTGAALCVAVTGVIAPLGCTDDEQPPAKEPATTTTTTAAPLLGKDFTALDLMGFDQQFSGFLDLVAAAKLGDLLSAEGPTTFLAPNSEAVEALGTERLDALRADPDGALGALVRRHLVEGKVSYADLVSGGNRTLTSVGGDELAVVVEGQSVTIGGAPVTKTDIASENGVIHVLGGVIAAG